MKLSLVGLFLLKAIVWFIVLLLVWHQLSSLVTFPVSLLSKAAVSMLFPRWAEGVEQAGASLTLLTTLEVQGMAGVPAGQVALLSPEVEFMKYGYGLPLLIALLIASNTKGLLTKICLGALALLPFQTWSVCFDWLKQAAIETGAAPFSPMAREIIAFGYQFGTLILPTLVPVLLWVVMCRNFLTTLMLEAALDGEAAAQAEKNKSAGS